MFAVAILKLAGDIRFELMMTISKTVALGQLGESPTNLVEQIGFEPIQQYCPPGYSREPFLSGVYSIFLNTLFPMCILKHTYFLGLPFPSEIIFLAFGLV